MRYAKKVDDNQKEIVRLLRRIPNVSVSLDHDDVLIGYKGRTFWYELKVSEKSEVKPHQRALERDWKGHYKIVYSLEDIMEDLGI